MIKTQLPPRFINEAGSIQNLDIAKDKLGFVSVIHCVAGSRRSSHYHKQDTHYLYVISGLMRYAERRQGQDPTEWMELETGECIYTPANTEHWTEFPEPTILLSISRLPRDHKSHEKDVVRVPWLGE